MRYNITTMDVRAYAPSELAEQWGISPFTLKDWREKGRGPRAIKLGGHVRYLAADVEEWLKSLPSSGDPSRYGRTFGSNALKSDDPHVESPST